jgi:hypothetical protein
MPWPRGLAGRTAAAVANYRLQVTDSKQAITNRARDTDVLNQEISKARVARCNPLRPFFFDQDGESCQQRADPVEDASIPLLPQRPAYQCKQSIKAFSLRLVHPLSRAGPPVYNQLISSWREVLKPWAAQHTQPHFSAENAC